MKLNFEVVRNRPSATQGTASVYLNGVFVATFADRIVRVSTLKSKIYYGEKIAEWASIVSDDEFIEAVLFHPQDGIYHLSDIVKKIIFKQVRAAK